MALDMKVPYLDNLVAATTYRTATDMAMAQLSTMRYDIWRYDWNTMQYKSLDQSEKIRNLEQKLKDKELKRENDLQSIISYFYKR